MASGDPDPRNPLSPYYPSETPGTSGRGRRWIAALLALILLSGMAYAAASVLLPL